MPAPPRITVFPLFPGLQAKPTEGERFFKLGWGAPRPYGTPPVCPSRIGARNWGLGRSELNNPLSIAQRSPKLNVSLDRNFQVSVKNNAGRSLMRLESRL